MIDIESMSALQIVGAVAALAVVVYIFAVILNLFGARDWLSRKRK